MSVLVGGFEIKSSLLIEGNGPVPLCMRKKRMRVATLSSSMAGGFLRLKSPSKLVKAGNVASAIGLRDRGAAMDSSTAFYRPPVHISFQYLLCLTQTMNYADHTYTRYLDKIPD